MILLPAATQHVHNTKGNDEISVSLCLLLFLNKKENRERERKKGKQDYPLNFCTHVNYFFGKGGNYLIIISRRLVLTRSLKNQRPIL